MYNFRAFWEGNTLADKIEHINHFIGLKRGNLPCRFSADAFSSGIYKAASGKFESERFCADKRVTTEYDVGFSYFCSILLLETLICGLSNCTFPMTRSLP
jgi:hypothetical protein